MLGDLTRACHDQGAWLGSTRLGIVPPPVDHWASGDGARPAAPPQEVPNKRTRELTEEELTILRDEVEKYMTEGDLRRFNALNIKRLKDIGCYRGRRHIAVGGVGSLPCALCLEALAVIGTLAQAGCWLRLCRAYTPASPLAPSFSRRVCLCEARGPAPTRAPARASGRGPSPGRRWRKSRGSPGLARGVAGCIEGQRGRQEKVAEHPHSPLAIPQTSLKLALLAPAADVLGLPEPSQPTVRVSAHSFPWRCNVISCLP